MRVIRWGWVGRVAVVALAALLLSMGLGYAYLRSFDLASLPAPDPASRAADLELLQAPLPAERGRVLLVVTSTAEMGAGGKRTGFELTELSRAYYVFMGNGFAVDIASPLGGEPPMVRDDEDMEAVDHAFLNDDEAQRKLQQSLRLDEVDASAYAAVYLAGGKGTLFDFPNNPALQSIVTRVYSQGGVIGAVCHGPAGLLGATDGEGRSLLRNRRITGFSNDEELFLIGNAREVFPQLLQDALVSAGANYRAGPMYLRHAVVDERLITGQNPWSTWAVAESMVKALGYAPRARQPSTAEQAVDVLLAYYQHGPTAAREGKEHRAGLDRRLVLMHAVVAAMQWRLRDAYHLQALARP